MIGKVYIHTLMAGATLVEWDAVEVHRLNLLVTSGHSAPVAKLMDAIRDAAQEVIEGAADTPQYVLIRVS